jgi:hypothetical protein
MSESFLVLIRIDSEVSQKKLTKPLNQSIRNYCLVNLIVPTPSEVLTRAK